MTTDSLNVKVTADVTNYTSQMENAKKKTTEFGDSVDKAAKETKSDFTPSVKEAAENLVKFGDTAGQAAKKANDGFSSIKSTIVSLGIGSLIKTSLTDAMNAVESESLFETSMGGFAQQARDWSINLSKNLGLDEYALRKNVGTLYNMTTSMGLSKDASYELSTGLVALGEDMASFYNLSSEEAFTKLRSGLTGEAEPLKALGILVNEATVEQYAYATGIAKTGEKLTEQQKVLARYQAILAQTTNAQGDLARTLDNPANQMRVTMNKLKTESIEFGTALMPVVQVTLPIFRQVIADIKPVAVDVANGIALLSSGMGMLENPAVRTIAYVGAVVGIMNKLKLAVGGPLSAILLLGSVLTWLVGKFGETEQKTAEVIDTSMQAATISTDEAVTSADNLEKKYKEVGDTVKGLTVPFDELTKASGGSKSTLGSTLVSGEDVENAETLNSLLSGMQNQTIDIAVPEIEIPEIEVPDIMPELDISGIDWNVIRNNLRAWIDEQDWEKIFRDVGIGFEQMFATALAAIDGLFGTKLLDLHEQIASAAYKWGEEINKAINGDKIERLNLEQEYEKEHGATPWNDFYKKVVGGMDVKEAYNSVFSTAELQDLFKNNYADMAKHWLTTSNEVFEKPVFDSSMGAQDIVEYLSGGSALQNLMFAMNNGEDLKSAFDRIYSTPALKGAFLQEDIYKLANASAYNGDYRQIMYDLDIAKADDLLAAGKTYPEILAEMEKDIKSYIAQGMSGQEALGLAKFEYSDFGTTNLGHFVSWYQDLAPEMQFEGKVDKWAKEIAERNSVNVPQASITSPITNADILTSLRSSAPTAAGAPIQLVNTIILDGEEMKNWTQKVQTDRNDETNGRQ